jgi:cation diffusion facilitator CzcD-associated flavoprotein CzcO
MDFEYSARTHRLIERFPALRKLDRLSIYLFMEFGSAGMTGRPWMLGPLRAAARWNIRRAISDPELRRKVTPDDEVGCKRVMLTDAWYPALAQPNVDLVTDRIGEITERGVRTADGRERPADAVILATGFRSTDFVAPMDIAGRGGRTLTEAWGSLPKAYLGASVPGFPNLFLLYGPNTNGGAGSALHMLESGVRHVVAAARALESSGSRRIEVRPEAAEAFDRELRAALARSVWQSGCTSWYVDADGNNALQWPWTWTTYRRRASRIDSGVYDLQPGGDRVPAGAGS